VEDRLLPLKQTVRHPLDPRTAIIVPTTASQMSLVTDGAFQSIRRTFE
jgi:hypothetical protein